VQILRYLLTVTVRPVVGIILEKSCTPLKIVRQKCTKIFVGWGSVPDPAGGAYSAPPDPLAV